MKAYMTTAELADHLTVSVSKVKEMISTGAIPSDAYFKHRRTYRFNVAKVEAFLLGDEPSKQLDLFNGEDEDDEG